MILINNSNKAQKEQANGTNPPKSSRDGDKQGVHQNEIRLDQQPEEVGVTVLCLWPTTKNMS